MPKRPKIKIDTEVRNNSENTPLVRIRTASNDFSMTPNDAKNVGMAMIEQAVNAESLSAVASTAKGDVHEVNKTVVSVSNEIHRRKHRCHN